MKITFRVLFCFLFVNFCSFVYAKRIYVDLAATTGTRDGTSWSNAYTRLDSALLKSFNGDSIWVAAGRYFPVGSKTTAYFSIGSGRKVFGGFNKTENSVDDRDLSANVTYLDGDIGVPGTANDNSYTIVRFINAANTTRFDGFTIVNGYAYTAGGGITVGGGGMRINASHPTISNCTFEDNYTYMRGGAVYSEFSSQPVFNNCIFRNNTTGTDVNSMAGAVFINSGFVQFNDCKFIFNSSRYGGAITSVGTCIASRCIFTGNSANSGSAMYAGDDGSINAIGSLFTGNLTSAGGIVEAEQSNEGFHLFTNCTFSNNKVEHSTASATLWLNDYTNIYNCIIWDNIAASPILYFPFSIEPTVKNSVVEGGFSTGDSIFTKNPQFLNPHDPQFAPFDGSIYNYSLKPGSSAVDAGDSILLQANMRTFDLKNEKRIQSNNIDIGSFESEYFAWKVITSVKGGGKSTGSGIYSDDSSVTLRAQVAPCYQFNGWLLNDSIISTDSIYSFTATENLTLEAEFLQLKRLVQGSVMPDTSAGKIANLGEYNCSDTVKSVVATASKCYKFKEWRENGNVISTNPVLNFTPNSNRNFVAVFTWSTYLISTSVSPSNGGTITGAGNYFCDSMVTLTAKKKPGFAFVRWIEGTSTVSVDSTIKFKATSARNLVAVFTSTISIPELSSYVNLYPNPSSSVIHIGISAELDYDIYDMRGKLISSGICRNQEILVSDLAEGLYLLEIRHSGLSRRTLFVKAQE